MMAYEPHMPEPQWIVGSSEVAKSDEEELRQAMASFLMPQIQVSIVSMIVQHAHRMP